MRRYGAYAQKTERGDVDHLFLTSLVDAKAAAARAVPRRRFDRGRDARATSGAAARVKRPHAALAFRAVARVPVSIYTKLLVAFLVIVGLLIASARSASPSSAR